MMCVNWHNLFGFFMFYLCFDVLEALMNVRLVCYSY